MKVGLMTGIKKGWGIAAKETHVEQSVRRKELILSRSDIHSGKLALVNRHHPVRVIPDASELAGADGGGRLKVLSSGIRLQTECLRNLEGLIAAARGQDRIQVVSGYRSKREQEEIYASSLKDNGSDYTSKYVALPGCSEHQTGLAVDVGEFGAPLDFIAPAFPDEGACLAFKKLADKFGFIQRYKADKEDITGISCEPWHFRYVGRPHAALMNEMGLCLEEYIDFIKAYTMKNGSLYRAYENSKCEIYYIEAGEKGAAVPLPDCDLVEWSGNNVDGFIITAFHSLKPQRRGMS